MIWILVGVVLVFVLNHFQQDIFYETNAQFYRVIGRSKISYASRRVASGKYKDGVL